MGGKWMKCTPEEKQDIRESYLGGETTTTLALRFGVSHKRMHRMLRRLNISLRGRQLTVAEEEQIIQIYLDGHSAMSIPNICGFSSYQQIMKMLHRRHIQLRSPSERNRRYRLNPHAFDYIDNEQTAYWLGFLYADGCISKHHALILSLKRDDKPHLYLLQEFLQSANPVLDRVSISKEKSYPQAYVQFSSPVLTSRLQQLGITTGRINPSSMIEAVPEFLYRHWLRGFLDGDGCISKGKRGWEIIFCGQIPILEYARKMLAKYAGMNPNLALTKHSRSDIYNLHYCGIACVTQIAPYLYQDATVFLQRKYAKVSLSQTHL